jgi:endonuclease YncB( thermonuclease family)
MSNKNQMLAGRLVIFVLATFLLSAVGGAALAAPAKAKKKASATPKAKLTKAKAVKTKATKAGAKRVGRGHFAAPSGAVIRSRHLRTHHHGRTPVVTRRVARVVAPSVLRRAGSVTLVKKGPTAVVVAESAEPASVLPTSDNSRNPISARVVQVIDGQTLLVAIGDKQRRVRLLGLDLAKSEAGEQDLEEASRLHLVNLVEGRRVSLSGDDAVAEEDEDGIAVAYVHREQDHAFINLKMIREGYALATAVYDYRLADIFARQQEHAEHREAGIWGLIGSPAG